MKWTHRRLLRFALKRALENLSLVVELFVLAWTLMRWMTR